MSAKKKRTLEAALRRVREAYHQRIAAELKGTEKTYQQIAEDIGVSAALVYLVNRLTRSRREPAQTTVEDA
jgi:transposase-like protein